MSLFIRVDLGFYTHRKTLRLFTKIGESAFWVPPRLWAYAASQQVDGVFEQYSAAEIAMLIGYVKDAPSMLQALIESGFMDVNPLRIHDWKEYNAFHAIFSERAKKAARARWDKEKERTKEKEGTEETETETETEKYQASFSIATSIASSMNGGADAFRLDDVSAETSAEQIYDLYPHKVGKPSALRAIRKALKTHDFVFLRERTAAYAEAVKGTDTILPHPATWFNDERFNNDPSTWARRNGKPVIKPDYSKGF